MTTPLPSNQSARPVKTLAFVSDALYPYNKGGKETRLYEITTRLAARGYDVHIYCMKWWKTPETVRVENGVTLHGICPYLPLYDGPRRSIKQGVLFGLACFKLLRAKFDVVDVDHMPFFPLYSMRVVCWLKGKKMTATWHEVWGMKYWQEYLGGVKGLIAGWIEAVSVRLPDKISAISELTARKLHSEFNVPKSKVTYIPCGFNNNEISKAKASIKKSDVIYVGRLLSHKHVDILIHSIKELKRKYPKIICNVIGSGPEELKLISLVKKMGLEKNIFFYGTLRSKTEVFSLMKSSRIFVLPSTREGFGIVVLEANACGLPVLTTNDPDNASQFIAQITSDLDTKKLSQGIERLITIGKTQKIKNKIKDNLEKYEWGDILKTYIIQVNT